MIYGRKEIQMENNIKKNKNQGRIPPQAKAIVQTYVDEGSLSTDPQGSYTGTPREPGEVPVQDADDL